MRWHFLALNYISFRRQWHPIYELEPWRYKNITMKLPTLVIYLQHDYKLLQKSSSRVFTVKYGIFYLHCQPLTVTPTWSRNHFSDALSARIPKCFKSFPNTTNKILNSFHFNIIKLRSFHRWAYVNQQGVRYFRLLEISSI